MYINASGFYIPFNRVSNDYFFNVNGLTSDWIVQRTGIHSRSKAGDDEDGIGMGKKAVAEAIKPLPYDVKEVDLIISGGYTPVDTVATLAHVIQREYNIKKAVTLMISSACSSFVNALEIAEGYFCMNKASKALIVCSEHNSLYNNETDPQSGHLWGDAAVAMFVSKQRFCDDEFEILDITTRGLGHVGKGVHGVYLRPKDEGLVMPDGRDVFMNATKYMEEALQIVTERNAISIADLDYIIPHQANMRIIDNMTQHLKFPEEKVLNNIHEYGNTGSASAVLVMLENKKRFKKGDNIALTVFGGGYSSGGVLIRV